MGSCPTHSRLHTLCPRRYPAAPSRWHLPRRARHGCQSCNNCPAPTTAKSADTRNGRMWRISAAHKIRGAFRFQHRIKRMGGTESVPQRKSAVMHLSHGQTAYGIIRSHILPIRVGHHIRLNHGMVECRIEYLLLMLPLSTCIFPSSLFQASYACDLMASKTFRRPPYAGSDGHFLSKPARWPVCIPPRPAGRNRKQP